MQRWRDTALCRGRSKRQGSVVELCPRTRSSPIYFLSEFWCMYPLSWARALIMQWRCPESSYPFMSSRHSKFDTASSELLNGTPKLLYHQLFCQSVNSHPNPSICSSCSLYISRTVTGEPCQLREYARLLTLGLVIKCLPGKSEDLSWVLSAPEKHLGAMCAPITPTLEKCRQRGSWSSLASQTLLDQ